MVDMTTLPEKDEAAVTALEVARAFKVEDADSYRIADRACVELKALEKAADKEFDEVIEEAYKHHKKLVAWKKGYTEPAIEARGIYKNKMDQWRRAEKMKEEAEQRRLQLEAKKLAEQQQLEEAEQAEAMGDKAQVEEILARPVQPVAVVMTSAVPKATTAIRRIPDIAAIAAAVQKGVRSIPGVSIYQVWEFKVVEAQDVPDQYKRTA